MERDMCNKRDDPIESEVMWMNGNVRDMSEKMIIAGDGRQVEIVTRSHCEAAPSDGMCKRDSKYVLCDKKFDMSGSSENRVLCLIDGRANIRSPTALFAIIDVDGWLSCLLLNESFHGLEQSTCKMQVFVGSQNHLWAKEEEQDSLMRFDGAESIK
jgi:hypothetical protein